jgi:DNA modification methylase
MGTGTTIIAAVKNDRIGIGIDVDPHAVALAKIRVKEGLE